MRRVKGLPGVISCGYTTFLPLTNRGGTRGFIVEKHQYPPGYVADSNLRIVTPEYLQTLGVALKAGRYLSASDTAGASDVLVVNEAFARRFLPNENPIGQRVSFSVTEPRWMTIVGVVGDVKQMGIDVPARAELYRPYTQQPDPWGAPQDFAIRTAGNPLTLAPAVRREIWAVDRDQPIADLGLMSMRVDEELMGRRVQMTLLSVFAGLAILLASLGIYAVLSYSVTQRRQEIGVRMALGAHPGQLVRSVVKDGMLLVISGLAIGIGGALLLGRAVSSMLFGVQPNDPRTFIAVTTVLAAVGFLASYVPARRAARVDPLLSLRYE
jgi:putative ABC transport system permease protein